MKPVLFTSSVNFTFFVDFSAFRFFVKCVLFIKNKKNIDPVSCKD